MTSHSPAGDRSWSQTADGWTRWWSVIERGTQVVSDRLVQLAELHLGVRVLDVATGLGEPAVTVARYIGPAGRVVAIDRSPEMLAVACRRAVSGGLNNIEFLQADAEQLCFPARSFQAVLCRSGSCSFAISSLHSGRSIAWWFRVDGSLPLYGPSLRRFPSLPCPFELFRKRCKSHHRLWKRSDHSASASMR